MSYSGHEDLLEAIVLWGRREPNVTALILTGSRARGEPVDDFSDIDIEVVARDVASLAGDDSWLNSFGQVMVRLDLTSAEGNESRLVFYDGGIKVDFTLCDRSRITEMTHSLDALYDRGFSVLLDKTGVTESLPTPRRRVYRRAPPTQDEFNRVVNEFWFEAAHIPRYLLRDELWVVKFRDWTMKRDLLRMLEWRAADLDTTSGTASGIGTRMKQWLDPPTWNALAETFSAYDRESSWAALLSSIELFRTISTSVAARHHLFYPTDTDAAVTHYIETFRIRFEDG